MENFNLQKNLPNNAKLIFKGLIFEIWQWEQEMFDGTKQTFEKAWRIPTVEIIATVGDKILIEEQDQPDRKNTINLVGGRADQGQDVLEEAKRELLEETGCESNDWSLFLKYNRGGKVIHDMYCFIARDCRKIQEQNLDAGEKIRTKLIGFEEFLKLTEEPRFLVSPDFINYLLRLQFDNRKKEEFRKLLFPER